MEKRIYSPLMEFGEEQISQIINDGDLNELRKLPFSVGEYVLNWKKAQDICVELMQHRDNIVRANAAMGLAYIARTKKRLEKGIVKPLLLRELKENIEYQWRIIDAIEDINIFMKWKIGINEMQRIRNQ